MKPKPQIIFESACHDSQPGDLDPETPRTRRVNRLAGALAWLAAAAVVAWACSGVV